MRDVAFSLGAKKFALFDVDGTSIDAMDNQRRVWTGWTERYGLDPMRSTK